MKSCGRWECWESSSSLEALQLLSQGYRHHSARDEASTLYYQRAIEVDPNLALAYVALGARYSNVGEMELASAAEKKAIERSDRLTGPARFLAGTLYYDLGTGELERLIQSTSNGSRHFPWIQGRTSTSLSCFKRSGNMSARLPNLANLYAFCRLLRPMPT